MRVGAIVEARMRASRLPGKVLMTAGGKPLLQILVERLQAADGLDAIVIATTTNKMDDPIVELAEALSVDVYRGSEDDVLGRRESLRNRCQESQRIQRLGIDRLVGARHDLSAVALELPGGKYVGRQLGQNNQREQQNQRVWKPARVLC